MFLRRNSSVVRIKTIEYNNTIDISLIAVYFYIVTNMFDPNQSCFYLFAFQLPPSVVVTAVKQSVATAHNEHIQRGYSRGKYL